jgi:hypothetical protein
MPYHDELAKNILALPLSVGRARFTGDAAPRCGAVLGQYQIFHGYAEGLERKPPIGGRCANPQGPRFRIPLALKAKVLNSCCCLGALTRLQAIVTPESL